MPNEMRLRDLTRSDVICVAYSLAFQLAMLSPTGQDVLLKLFTALNGAI